MTHDQAHTRVLQDIDTYLVMPRTGGQAGRLRRREQEKHAARAIQWHLSVHHGWRHVLGPPVTLLRGMAIHERLHRGGEV